MSPNIETKQEVRFVKNLGRWGVQPRNRSPLIYGYLIAALKRDDWGDIDGQYVIAFCYGELWALGHPEGCQTEEWRQSRGLTKNRRSKNC